MTQNYHKHSATPGRVDSSALLCGALGLLVSGVLYRIGLLGKGDLKILNLLSQPVFGDTVPSHLSTPVLFLLTGLFCLGLAFAVLDSPGVWRRLVLGLTLLILVVAMVPTLAVWNIYFPPVVSLVGVFWTWFASMMYASHHQMPCDRITPQVQQPETQQPEEILLEVEPEPLPEEEEIIQEIKEESNEKAESPKVDLDAKYKPKE